MIAWDVVTQFNIAMVAIAILAAVGIARDHHRR